GRKGRGNLAADMTRLAHAGDDEPPLGALDHSDRRDQRGAQAVADGRGERADAARFGFERAQRRLDLESPRYPARYLRLGHGFTSHSRLARITAPRDDPPGLSRPVVNRALTIITLHPLTKPACRSRSRRSGSARVAGCVVLCRVCEASLGRASATRPI